MKIINCNFYFVNKQLLKFIIINKTNPHLAITYSGKLYIKKNQIINPHLAIT